WLPLLFLLVYLLTWLGWWLWVLLAAEEELSAHPDIDAAWEATVLKLKDGGIDVTEVPLFLVLGQPEGSLDALFKGSQIDFVAGQESKHFGAPLQVYANADAVFVACPGASLLSRQAMLLADEDAPP